MDAMLRFRYLLSCRFIKELTRARIEIVRVNFNALPLLNSLGILWIIREGFRFFVLFGLLILLFVWTGTSLEVAEI